MLNINITEKVSLAVLFTTSLPYIQSKNDNIKLQAISDIGKLQNARNLTVCASWTIISCTDK